MSDRSASAALLPLLLFVFPAIPIRPRFGDDDIGVPDNEAIDVDDAAVTDEEDDADVVCLLLLLAMKHCHSGSCGRGGPHPPASRTSMIC